MGLMDKINQALEDSRSSKRSALPESELRKRIKYYEETSGIKLTHEHTTAARDIFCDLRNVLITGGAGTGKTTFIKHIVIPELNYRGLNFAVTATTGIAGSHLDGKTLHSWAGIGLGPVFPPFTDSPVDMEPEEVQAVYKATWDAWATKPKMDKMRSAIAQRIKGTEVLIIDESSMLAGVALLGYVDYFMRKHREADQPFGGVQVIFVGDFCQLPPVEKGDGGVHVDWAFLSPAWHAAKVKTTELTVVFRQEDKEFANFLNHIRLGKRLTAEEERYALGFVREQSEEEIKKASFLVPTNKQADKLNEMALDWYPKPTYYANAEFTIREGALKPWEDAKSVKAQLRNAPHHRDRLAFRIGLPVMFTVNDRGGRFVNGTKGFVEDVKVHPATNEVIQLSIRLPARDNEFSGGDDADNELIKAMREESDPTLIILNRHIRTRADTEPAEDTTMDVNAEGARTLMPMWPRVAQFPLIPATAITIHKAQGATLDDCTIDLNRSFAPGHVYVAMSRLRTAAGLTLVSSDFTVKTDPDVMRFYRKIRQDQIDEAREQGQTNTDDYEN